MAATSRPILTRCYQGAAVPVPPRLRHHIKLGQTAMTALRLYHKEMTGRLMREGPADRFFALFRDQEDAVLFGAAMLQLAPMFDGKTRIAPAVGLERGLVILQPRDEGQDRRLVGGQMCFADANGRAP